MLIGQASLLFSLLSFCKLIEFFCFFYISAGCQTSHVHHHSWSGSGWVWRYGDFNNVIIKYSYGSHIQDIIVKKVSSKTLPVSSQLNRLKHKPIIDYLIHTTHSLLLLQPALTSLALIQRNTGEKMTVQTHLSPSRKECVGVCKHNCRRNGGG